MIDIDVVQLIVEVLIVLLLLYLAFLKSYFQEKGKNLATKEDVEEITSKVESIRSTLQFSLQAKLSWRAEEHNSLVDYYSRYGLWLSGITDISPVGVSDENMARLDEKRAELDALERDFESAASRMELFVENEEIIRQKGLLKKMTLELQWHAKKITFDLAKLYLEMRKMKAATPLEQQIEPYRELLDRVGDLYKKFKNEQIQLLENLLPLVVEHRRTISTHLRNLVRNEE